MGAGTYIGPLGKLRGQRALVLPAEGRPDCVKAQFDDTELMLDDFASVKHLGYGWHQFPRDDFDMDLELDA